MAGLGQQYTDVGDLLRALVRVPSVNPDGEPGTAAENCGEGAIADFVGELLQRLGAEVRFDEIEPGRPNVIGTFPGGEGKPAVVLGPHTDTVGVGGMTVDPFGGERRDGRIYGRGASDTKGTMAAMLWALSELGAEAIAGLDVGVTFAGFMGEETGQPGSRHFAKTYAGRYAFGLVGEPTGCDIVYKHKGTAWFTLEVEGKAAHGATPERGDSAITKMAELVLGLEGEFRNRIASDAYADPVLGRPTVNVGMIGGGTRSNIVPERCTAQVDMRVTPALGVEGGIALLEEFVAGRAAIAPSLRCTPLDTPEGDPFVQRLLALPSAPELVGAPWFCDAAVLAEEGGIPSVAAGPGDIAQAHTADEWIDEGELQEGVAFYRDFLKGVSS